MQNAETALKEGVPAVLRTSGRGRPPAARLQVWYVLSQRYPVGERISISLRELADAAGVSVTAAWQAVRTFEKLQLIAIQVSPSRRGGKTTIEMHWRPTATCGQSPAPSPAGEIIPGHGGEYPYKQC